MYVPRTVGTAHTVWYAVRKYFRTSMKYSYEYFREPDSIWHRQTGSLTNCVRGYGSTLWRLAHPTCTKYDEDAGWVVIDSVWMRRRMLPYIISDVGAASGPRARAATAGKLTYIATRTSWEALRPQTAPSFAGR